MENQNGNISESSLLTSIAVLPPIQPMVPTTQVAEISPVVQYRPVVAQPMLTDYGRMDRNRRRNFMPAANSTQAKRNPR